MKRIVAVAALVLVLAPPVGAQTVPTQQVAFIVRVPLTSPLDDPSNEQPPGATSLFDDLAESLARWSKPPLDRVPVALAVSPALCDELRTLHPPQGQRLLRELRRLSARAAVLTVPYADVWLPFFATEKEVREQLREGSSALKACLGRKPGDVLFAHVLHTGDSEPVEDLDTEAVAAARDVGVRTVIARGPTQAIVRSDGVELVPWYPGVPPLDEDGALRDDPIASRVAVITDALDEPAVFRDIERLATSDRVNSVSIQRLGDDAPQVSVAFPSDPRIDGRSREAIAGAHEAVIDLSSILVRDDPLRIRLKSAHAAALGQTSKDEERNARFGEHRRTGRTASERIASFVDRELAKISIAEGSVTFTSRRGSVPVTVTNETTFPVKVRVSVQSPKLSFPDGRTVVRTIEPPGGTITFAALAESSGTFPLTAVIKSPRNEVTVDRTELIVRSTAANLPVLILTIGGALFLVVVYGRRIGHRRREAS